jgi:hypothetical protein
MNKIKNIQLTRRDKDLMRWVNKVGFVTIALIAAKFDVALSTAYGRVRKLVDHAYLRHQRIYHGLPGVYCVAKLGLEWIGGDLPVVKNIPRGSYDHDLQVTKIMLALSKKYSCDFVSERELRYLRAQGKIGQRGHIADGELLLDDKKIAVEVELSTKGDRRLQKIMNEYMKNFDINEVWYFCGDEYIKRQVIKHQGSCSFLKVFELRECVI